MDSFIIDKANKSVVFKSEAAVRTDQQSLKKDSLIMKIKELKLTNFRCFESLSIEMDEQLTVLIAPNGAGKTAVLDAIALGLGSFVSRFPDVSGISPSKNKDLHIRADGSRAAYMRIYLKLTNGSAWDRTVKRDRNILANNLLESAGLTELYRYADRFIYSDENTKPPPLPVIAYYGTARGIFDARPRQSSKKQFRKYNIYVGALEAKASFRQCSDRFYLLEDYERREKEKKRDWDYRLPQLDAVRKAIETMLPEFSNPRTEVRPLRFVIDWKQDQGIRTLRIDQLSDGHRSALAMVMDIASRMTETSLTAKNIMNTEGIVLIDEVELHLHPGWQQTILSDLMRTFPNVQFIVTTHSPQVLSTVRQEQIYILGRNADGSYAAARPRARTYAEERHDVLQAVMGVDPQPPVPEKKDLEYLTELADQGLYDTDEAEKLLKKLKEGINPNHSQLKRIERSIERQRRLERIL